MKSVEHERRSWLILQSRCKKWLTMKLNDLQCLFVILLLAPVKKYSKDVSKINMVNLDFLFLTAKKHFTCVLVVFFFKDPYWCLLLVVSRSTCRFQLTTVLIEKKTCFTKLANKLMCWLLHWMRNVSLM